MALRILSFQKIWRWNLTFPGSGSTVSPGTLQAFKEQVTMTAGANKKLRMLVVDDEPNVCDCICLLLSCDGHEVVAVNSGRAALAVFEKNKFDLIFTDYSMPGMKGDELAAAIKALAPNQLIMMLSGFAPAPETLSGVDFILGKPFGLDDLRAAITKLAQGKCFAE
jgi:CheY-like chemotaxis protein